jgi:antitoxin component YwqK of YwqJK toxin-antitoxin module
LNVSPYSGKVYDLYDSGQLKEEFEVSAGVMNGQRFTFFKDSRFKKENYQDSVLMYSLEEDLGKLNTILTNLKKDSSNYNYSKDSLRSVIGKKYYKLRDKYSDGKLRGKKLRQYEEYLSWCDKVDKKTKEITEYSLERQVLQNNLNTEKNKEIYSNKIEESFTYSKGILNGEYKRFNNQMTIMEQGEFSNGKKNGPWTTFSYNGKTIYTYQQDIKEGKYEKFDGDKVIESGMYSKNLKQGDWKYCNYYGKLTREETYLNDKLNGNYKKFDGDVIVEEGKYLDGLMDGEWIFRYSNGKLKGKGKYVKGDGESPDLKGIPVNGREGAWIRFHENGIKEQETFFKNGKLSGIRLQFNENGILKDKYNYVNDKEEGERLSYYDSGELEWRCFNINGNRDKTKKTTRYHKNGQVWYEGYAGDKDKEWYGEQKEYYENGKLKKIDVYDNSGTGKILSTRNFDINGKEIKQKSVNEEFGTLAGRNKLLDKIKEEIEFTSPSSVKPIKFCFVDKNNSSYAKFSKPMSSNYKGTFVVILDAQNTFGVYIRSTCWVDIYLKGDGTYGFKDVMTNKGENGYEGILDMPDDERYKYNWQPFY